MELIVKTNRSNPIGRYEQKNPTLGSEVKVWHVLELIVRIKKICNPDLVTSFSSVLENIFEGFYSLPELSHKALLFSKYKSQFYGVLATAMYLWNINSQTLAGDIPPELRLEVVNQFKASKTHLAEILFWKVGVGLKPTSG